MAKMNPIDPPLKFAGGKRWLLPRLRELWQGHESFRLVEPFCGAAAISLGLAPKRVLLNDINPHLINFLQQLQQGLIIPETLPMENDVAIYYQNRTRFNEISSLLGMSAESAALFYYLNRTGFNGLCRFNSSGGFNVPFGRYATINYRRDFLDYQNVLYGWKISCGSYEQVAINKNDFVYADPPYDVEFTKYSKEGFSWEDQVRLAGWLARHSGPVVASNQATTRIVHLYKDMGFDVSFVDAPRRISNTGDRTPAQEIIATRNI